MRAYKQACKLFASKGNYFNLLRNFYIAKLCLILGKCISELLLHYLVIKIEWSEFCVNERMLKKLLTFSILILSTLLVKSQSLDWHLTAHAGTARYHFENFQGAFLAGFQNQQGQQFSFGPVVKGYEFQAGFKNMIGGRIYSQAKIYKGLSMYLQCDVFDGVRSQSIASAKSPMRLETGAGIIYTVYNRVGVSAGYNLGELNPVAGIRQNTPSVKLIYLMPVGNRGW